MMDRLDSDYATSVPFPSPSHHIPVPSPFAAQRGGNRREEGPAGAAEGTGKDVNETREARRVRAAHVTLYHLAPQAADRMEAT